MVQVYEKWTKMGQMGHASNENCKKYKQKPYTDLIFPKHISGIEMQQDGVSMVPNGPDMGPNGPDMDPNGVEKDENPILTF